MDRLHVGECDVRVASWMKATSLLCMALDDEAIELQQAGLICEVVSSMGTISKSCNDV